MYLQSLSAVNFKNFNALDIELSSRINCFTGNNGAGKTNILDAIYYLSFCKSFFSNIDAMSVNHEANLFVVQGEYSINEMAESVYCAYERDKKKHFKRNKKEYDKLADHIGLIPLVMISPSDIHLILGGSEERRKFMDGIISQFDRQYLYELQKYNRILLQRNSLLKSFEGNQRPDFTMLELYDMQMEESGMQIYRKRKEFIEQVIPVFQRYFNHISQGNEVVSLRYNSQLDEAPLGELLNKNRHRDLAARYTTTGIHKDDLDLFLGDFAIKKLGSQGQQKTYLVALKLAQFEYIQQQCGFKPILLLDDVFDKLDSTRMEQIIKLVAQNNFGQIFITDTNANRIQHVIHAVTGEYFHFEVDNALVKRVNETQTENITPLDGDMQTNMASDDTLPF